MELRHLRYFVAVVEEQSFTKAAEKLFIAQPPLSRQIQNLETELGALLFERGSRPLKPTAVGHFFYQQAVKLLSSADQMKSITMREGIIKKTITIGFGGSLLYGLLPRVVYLFRQQQPYLKIKLVQMNAMEQIDALKEGRIDASFGRVRISDPAIKRILLREEPLMVAVHSSHALAAKKQGVKLEEIVEEHVLLYPNQPKPSFSTQMKGLFSEYGLEPKNLTVVEDIQLALGLVAAGEGLCIVPESAKTMQFKHLNYIPILDDDAVSPVFLIIRNADNSDYIRSLLDSVYQVYDLEAIKYDRRIF
ncbi:LysR family transcriptional regulator [Acinetobacter terrae]|uniref:LysR family transcriptional regulator n=1 Tax=Acinetobacter terrae TaxID=2731247 RepID=UPI0007D85252|nr:LysR family transcriptional regulator [Acinetobacter terrae]NNG77608.1 LysR family transcriptional regulator [Acinetobacter terrae]OAL76968.1 LysR family transcriptional regulator [Acinetobacter terrae]